MIENLEGEMWKPVFGYEGLYEVSNMGRTKAMRREYYSGKDYRIKQVVEESLMKIQLSKWKYMSINLSKKGLHRHMIHRLVAQSFIPNPENKPQVNHIDGNKLNNCAKNLEWCTQSENMIHAYDIGLSMISEKCKEVAKGNATKLFSKKVVNTETGEVHMSAKQASILYNVNYKTLLSHLNNKNGRANKTLLKYVQT